MKERRSIRVMHQGNPDRQLAYQEAVLYLATRELPERTILTEAPPDFVDMYQNSNDTQKRDMRLSGGHLTVACGHVVHHEALVERPGANGIRRPAFDGWEAITGLEVTITPFDPEANVVTGGGDIALSMAGRARTVDEAQALLRVMAVAAGISAQAQIQVYTQFVVSN